MRSAASVVHPDGVRRTGGPGIQLGDARLQENVWLLNPLRHSAGNAALGPGVKIPTANEAVSSAIFTPNGPVERPVEISQQPGDSGWGIILEAQGFRTLFQQVTAYGSGFYLYNPRNTNGAEPPQSSQGNGFFMSVPDQYGARIGVSVPVWPAQGIAPNLGGRVDGMPVTDILGSSEGFRRPGYVIFFDPGITWNPGENSFNFSVPVAVARSIQTSLLDESRGVRTGGGLADFLVAASYFRRF